MILIFIVSYGLAGHPHVNSTHVPAAETGSNTSHRPFLGSSCKPGTCSRKLSRAKTHAGSPCSRKVALAYSC